MSGTVRGCMCNVVAKMWEFYERILWATEIPCVGDCVRTVLANVRMGETVRSGGSIGIWGIVRNCGGTV